MQTFVENSLRIFIEDKWNETLKVELIELQTVRLAAKLWPVYSCRPNKVNFILLSFYIVNIGFCFSFKSHTHLAIETG